MKSQQEWETLRNKMTEQSYDWNLCFEKAQKIKKRRLIQKYVAIVLLELLVIGFFIVKILPEKEHAVKVYEVSDNSDEMIIYVDDEPYVVSGDFKRLDLINLENGRHTYVLPRWESMQGNWTVYGGRANLIESEVFSNGVDENGNPQLMERLVIYAQRSAGYSIFELIAKDQNSAEEITIRVTLDTE